MPKLVPGKTDAECLEAHIVEAYRKLKENKDEGLVILFMDAAHPLNDPVMTGGWIQRNYMIHLKKHTGRQRLNINGVINIETMAIAEYLHIYRHSLEIPTP